MTTSSGTAAASGVAGQGSGILYGFGAYLTWGFLPLYFRMLDHVGSMEVVASRILWSLLLLLVILALRGTLGAFAGLIRQPRAMLTLTVTAGLIAINWLVYIWAVNHGHVLAASLGYFLNPLVNVLLGFAVLKERLGQRQWIAIALAATGVVILATAALDTLWISLTLAVSFSLYGLLRKIAPVTALQGLTAETLILSPASLLYMAWLGSTGALAMGSDASTSGWLAISGVITSVPLLLFAVAAKRMAYSTLGLLQYIAPTIQFLIGFMVFGETLSHSQLWSFGLIWIGLALYTADSLRQVRAERRPLPGME